MADAQFGYATDVLFVTRYEWRGLTRGSGWSFQPAVSASYDTSVRLAGGIWANIQTAGRDVDRGFGFDRQWLGEVNPWAEVGVDAGALDLAAGWMAYLFDGDDSVMPGLPLEDTHELYLRARVLSIPLLLPSLSYYHDVGKYDGGYFEPAISFRLPFWPQAVLPVGSLFLTARAGFSLGQEIRDAEFPVGGHFGERGLTHWDFSLSLPVSPIGIGRLALSPIAALHLQLNRDPIGREKTISDDDGTTWWVRFGFSVAGPRCRPQREVCNP